MSPDEIINEIFRIEGEVHPDDDPGDITIDIQDDMPLVVVYQSHPWRGSVGLFPDLEPLAAAGTVQQALEDALAAVQRFAEREREQDGAEGEEVQQDRPEQDQG